MDAFGSGHTQPNATPPSSDVERPASVGTGTVPPTQPVQQNGGHRRKASVGDGLGLNPSRRGLPKRIPGVSQLIDEFVQEHGGDRPIYSVLVANNGLAAVKFMRSVRSWANKTFGNPKAISLVAMATPDDIRINAEHVSMADQFVEVPGGTNNNNYANVRLIVQTAEQAGVDAVWPGWGHASENPELPAALDEINIRFLGPSAEPMAALGDKVGSTIIAQATGMPTIAWSGTGVELAFEQCNNGKIPEDVYERACVHSIEEAVEACARIGYPVMLKASWGGGGKGIRKVHSEEEVRHVFKQVQGEVPGSPVFAMKLAPLSRHLEVQLLCDMHGNVASLYSRDCSVQRRHQKIIEEGPVTAAPEVTLRKMEACARALARSVRYVGAATVEFLYTVEGGEFFFLELNPRLQVEHPVTEGITGVNIPACQLMIGMGLPLWRIPEIRELYAKDPRGSDSFDLETSPQRSPDGHVVAVRITSEDTADGFKPTCGRVDELHFRPTPEVWGYFSIKSGGGIHEFSDSQFGHLFAKGPTRAAAISAMKVALREVSIRGEIRTSVDYCLDMLQSPELLNNQVHTGWLDARIAAKVKAGRVPWHLAVIAGAVVKCSLAVGRASAEYLGYLSKGQLPPASVSLVHMDEAVIIDGIKYKVNVSRTAPDGFLVRLNGSEAEARIRKMADGGYLMQVDGGSHVVHVEEEAGGTRLLMDGMTVLLAREADPSRVLAASPGKLVRQLCSSGEHVQMNQPFAEVEVMKMVMPLLAPAAGVLTFSVPEGAVLAGGELIARLQLDDPGAVVRAEVFAGTFPELGPPQIPPTGLDQRFAQALDAVRCVLAGYERPVAAVVEELVACLDHPELALLQWREEYSVVRNRLPGPLCARLESIAAAHQEEVESWAAAAERLSLQLPCEFPAQQMRAAMNAAVEECRPEERSALCLALEPLQRLAAKHAGGREEYARRVVGDQLEAFLAVEEAFRDQGAGSRTEQEVVDGLRQAHAGGPAAVLELVLAHQSLSTRVELLQRLLSCLVLPDPAAYRAYLRRLAALADTKGCADLALRAQQLLEQSLLADLRVVVARALSGLDMFKSDSASLTSPQAEPAMQAVSSPHSSLAGRRSTFAEGLYSGLMSMVMGRSSGSVPGAVTAQVENKMEMLVGVPAAVEDALASLLVDAQPTTLRTRAMLTYVKRVYSPFLLREPFFQYNDGILMSVWLYDDPGTANTSGARQCFGAMLVLDALSALGAGLAALRTQLHALDLRSTPGTLHVALAGDEHMGSAVSGSDESWAAEPAGPLSRGSSAAADESLPDSPEQNASHTAALQAISSAVSQSTPMLQSLHLQCVSLLAKGTSALPLRAAYTWEPAAAAFRRERFSTHVEPLIARLLELPKLSHYPQLHYTPSRNRQWHMYMTQERPDPRSYAMRRMFMRSTVRQLGHPALLAASYSGNSAAVAAAAVNELEETLVGCLEELNRPQAAAPGAAEAAAAHPDWTHLFFSVLPPLPLQPGGRDDGKVATALRAAAAGLVAKHSSALRLAAVAAWEVRLRAPLRERAWRLVVSSPTGHEQGEEHVEVYREQLDSSGQLVYVPADASSPPGPLAGQPVLGPYPPMEPLHQKRLAARRHHVTYCYDFPTVFENALRDIWASRAAAGEPGSNLPAGRLVEAEELVLQEGRQDFRQPGRLRRIQRPIGRNDCGMVAWVLNLKTPECPQGRQVVAVANDITYQSGAFSPAEDALFRAACELSLEERLPLVYLAANSGARVGLATEVRDCLQVQWVDPADPSRGPQYLYLTDADCQRLRSLAPPGHVVFNATRQLTADGSIHWVLHDVVGLEDGLGVECLSGSGAIASAFARAFREGYTLTLVSGRTVGIGAYLARLGRRCVQRADQPIILTGYAALNKLLGRQVYTSHMQLGGPRVMGVNGVSHHVVADDLEGARTLLRLLAFAPPELGAPHAHLPSMDPVERPIAYVPPPGEKLDPRAAIAGVEAAPAPARPRHTRTASATSISSATGSTSGSGSWQSGLFDRGSWLESQAGWAKTVITGRARLGGMPVGVIAVETQTVMRHMPADPGTPDSSEQIVPQAGQVWYPDSADKTAQAMEEFELEGLPLFILANWRGFSGGQRDLFDGVLQAGSLIVERLRTYTHPVFVYIPCGAELRGGAWVVVDSCINASQVEMYADPSARGGVLEPEGVVEIKFRQPDLLKMMHRLDPIIRAAKTEGGMGADSAIKARERLLLPLYQQVARSFADMHDTPLRMLAKGVLQGVVPWTQARSFFAQRLHRRLVEAQLVRHVASTDPHLTRSQAVTLVRSWHTAAQASAGQWSLASPPRGAAPAAAHWDAAASGSNPPAPTGGRDLSDFESQMEAAMLEDQSFLEWAESGSGRAHIGSELKALRSQAAASIVSGVLGTPEGKDGLLRALQTAMQQDNVLALQLRMLISQGLQG